jgi:glycosyltransferase involved in cell wall biosynthesis
MRFSVIVPAFNAASTLPGLLGSIARQTYQKDFEVIVIDDHSSDGTADIAHTAACNVIRLQQNRGPAHCRNLGAKVAGGDFLIFTDSDCSVAVDWLDKFERNLATNDTDSVMGRLVLLPSNLLGDSISALGFPAGGSIGFDKMWPVDEHGYTSSLSSCNCAIKKELFEELGGFDESFPYAGGEDSLLAYRLIRNQYRIKYCPDVVAYHPARDSMRGFVRWQFKRGVSSYIFSRKIEGRKQFVSLRLWSVKNVLTHCFPSKKFPLVVFLLASSLVTQGWGFLYAKHRGCFI